MQMRRGLVWLSLLIALSGLLRAQSTSPVLTQPLPGRALFVGGAAMSFDLSAYFAIPGVTGPVAQFDTVLGKFNVELLTNDAPLTVANFLNYANRGAYTNSFIHRSMPGFVIQGGGYTINNNVVGEVTTEAPVQNEFKVPNTRGTLAMAKLGGDPNSATSQWFVNLADNRSNLDNQNGGFTVFARVLGTGMTVVDAIAALPTYNANTALNSPADGPFSNLPLRTPNLSAGDLVTVRSVQVVPLLAAADTAAAVTLSLTSSDATVATATLSGSTLTLTPLKTGATTITVLATDVNGNAAFGVFTATVDSTPQPAEITTQPEGHVVAAGSPVVLSVGATGSALTYQWAKDGVAIDGATSARLLLDNVQAADAGSYRVTVTAAIGAPVVSSAADVSVSAAATASRIVNLSIRATSGTGDKVLIMGFVVGGGAGGATPLLIRGVGPSLLTLGVTDPMADPTIQVVPAGVTTPLASNDDWGGAANIKAAATLTGAFALDGDTSKDAALVSDVAGGVYTVLVGGAGNTTGTVLAEIYDATTAASATVPRLVNISARGYVSGGDQLIAGFVVQGATAKTVLIRAIGPDAAFATAVGGANLDDPKLLVYRAQAGANTLVSVNDDWSGDAAVASVGSEVGAMTLTNAASKDAAVLVTLDPGVYTAQAASASGHAGIALVEVYEVP